KAAVKSFVFDTCKAEANWNMKNFVNDQVELIRQQVGDKKVLGITINCISKDYGYGESLVYALGSASGFLLSMVVMAGVRERAKTAVLPKSFQGTPILYVAAGLLSLAFLGFKGLIK
ncbi:MAG: hypothetical protein II367_00060, partial [Treponema sp.]|nr:hypothetical protein [Treponema sp.]